jgi:leucyl/phenylalanyl-tRNA---protein transferase
MAISKFPPVEDADENGLLAVGGDLELDSLLLAYRNGIFPWPLSAKLLAWFSPPLRCLLFFDELKIPRSLKKAYIKRGYTHRRDSDFAKVIQHCATSAHRTGQKGSWITPEMTQAYLALHMAGYAHSFESYNEGKLVGGLYGVKINRFFAGESMFYLSPDASKIALLEAIAFLKAQQVEWIDCQVPTPLLLSFGAREVTRGQFLKLLKEVI